MRKTRRFASFALAACMGVSLLANVPAGTASATEPDTVVETENVAEAVTGTDATETSEADFKWRDTKIEKYIGTSTEVVIPSKCTEIGFEAFAGDENLTSVVIPDSVTEIEEQAFWGCSSLKSVTIPDGLTEIKNSVFADCSSLDDVTIPDSVTEIGLQAFMRCSSLKSITIPEGVTEIKQSVFLGCSSLEDVTLPSGLTTIWLQAFTECSSLKNITLDGVVQIWDYAFEGCSSLTSIEIPDSVQLISPDAFINCGGLEKIKIDENNTNYDSRNNCNAIIESDSNVLITGCKNTKIPDGVKRIGDSAFSGCGDLTSIGIPNSVTEIGDEAFLECSKLKGIVIPDSVTEIGEKAFYNCKNMKTVTISKGLKKIEDKTFDGCSSLKNITIPKSVTKIGYGAFHGCSGLTDVVIPDSVTEIGDYAFSMCSGLKSITIPKSVTQIGGSAFSDAVIWGYAGSYAETWAREHSHAFQRLSEVTVPTVTNVKAVPAGKNKVNVTWNKVSGATGYIVYAKKNGNYAKLTVTAATSYTDTKALDNEYNFYFVYAYTKTPSGKIVVGKCQKYAYAKGTCKAVTNLKASSVKGGVKLTWTKSVGADGYIVYGKRTGGTYGYVGMTSKNTATSFTDKGADKKNYNFYWVFPYHNKNGKRVVGPICGYVYGKAK